MNTPGVMINISHLDWYENYRVTNIMNNLFSFISWPSKKIIFQAPVYLAKESKWEKFVVRLRHEMKPKS